MVLLSSLFHTGRRGVLLHLAVRGSDLCDRGAVLLLRRHLGDGGRRQRPRHLRRRRLQAHAHRHQLLHRKPGPRDDGPSINDARAEGEGGGGVSQNVTITPIDGFGDWDSGKG